MGIMINLSVSKNLTQGEWEPAYEETLQLIKDMPFVERRTMSIDGIEVRCLGHTQERVQWQGDLGWKAEGDSDSLRMAEPFYLFRKLPFASDGTAGDPMLDMVLSGENTFGKNAYTLWCNKTQGEAYHMYLLAVAVTLADRLKGKVWVSGDITRGQLREAARLANEILTNQVEIPDTCDIVRWYERITQLPLSEDAKIDAFDEYILVKKDLDYGEFLREHFSRDVLRKYWNRRFEGYTIGSSGFKRSICEYLRWGFKLEDLAAHITLDVENEKASCKKIIKSILETHVYEEGGRNTAFQTREPIDPDAGYPYGMGAMFADVTFGQFYRKNVERYIPLQELKEVLGKAYGDICDVDDVVDTYISAGCRDDSTFTIRERLDKECQKYRKVQEEYDVYDTRLLKYYEKEDQIAPDIVESLQRTKDFMKEILEEEDFKELLEGDPEKRCKWIVDQNQFFWLRKPDWDKIFKDVKKGKDAFERYYPIFRVDAAPSSIYDQCLALLINDTFFEYMSTL